MKNQLGMTMVELIIAISITGVIVAFLGTAVYQITTVSEYGNDKFTAMHELQNAAYWFNKDGQEAVGAVGGSQLTLTLADNSTVTYTLVNSSLKRITGGGQLILAQNIFSVSFTVNSRLTTMQLVAAPESRSGVRETGTYMVYLRPAGG